MIDNLKTYKLLCPEEHAIKLFEILEEKIKKNKIPTSLYLKTVASCFIPYESTGLLTQNEVDSNKIGEILKEVDFQKIQEFESTSDLIEYVIDYFEEKIVDKQKYKLVLACLSLTFKGLKLDEIKNIVIFET